ncbi:MAG: ParB/RepB/Spo0J family partition protein [Georgenia sp.]
MSEKRRGLGRGIGALIPSGPGTATIARPVDVFFTPSSGTAPSAEEATREGDEETGETRRPPTKAQAAAQSLMAPSKAARARSASAQPRRAAKPAGAAKPDESVTPDESVRSAEQTRPVPAAGAAEDTPDQEPAPSVGSPRAGAADATPDDGALVPVPGAQFAELPVGQIVPNTRQPRQVFDEDDLDELAASIREVGVLQPVVVRPLAVQPTNPDEPRFELIMGERRWRASRQAGNATVPAIIRDTTDGDLLRDALLENLHRADLNPLEEAAAYQQLLGDFGCTHDELAARIARSRPQISNTLRLLKLPPLVQRRVAAGVLSAGHARALLGLSDGAAMERLAQKIVAEGLSVRATEEIVALGDEPAAPEMRRRPRTTEYAEGLDHLATRLADRLDTRVKVNLGQRKGRIAIEFASVEDLNRILDVLAPGEQHVGAAD